MYMLLKNGSKGGDVKKLQEKLGLKADGLFGPGTEKAVKDWQSKNGLTPDGIITSENKSWDLIFGTTSTSNSVSNVTIPPTDFKLEKLKVHIPDSVIAQIPETAAKFNITNTLRLAHFLAQCGHESGNFKAVTENLNYSADGLKKIFGKYFPGDASSYARNPEKIANRVYGGRMGNGDETTGDGFKFRGRGALQLTGKANYEAFSKFLNKPEIMTNPDLVATEYAFESALYFFEKNKIWAMCDKGVTKETILAVTKAINGGTNGLTDREVKTIKFYGYLKS